MIHRAIAFIVAVALFSAYAGSEPVFADDAVAVMLTPTWAGPGQLSAKLISPLPDNSAQDTTTMVDVRVPQGAVVELTVNDQVVPKEQIGKKGDNAQDRTTDWYFYGVRLNAGPNSVKMVALGANGLRGDPVTKTIFGPGDSVRLDPTISNDLPADGKSVAHIVVFPVDRWGHRAAPHLSIHAVITKGSARFLKPSAADPSQELGKILEDAENNFTTSSTRQTELNGSVDFPIVAGLTPGEVEVQLSTDSGVVVPVRFYSEAQKRKPLVVGLATAGAGSVPGLTGTDATVEDGANSRRGRIAIYAKGSVDNKTVVTAAYDTANTLDDWANGQNTYNPNPLDRPYSTFGDSSSLMSSALSLDHLYLRVDRGPSYLQYGEFTASTQSSSLNAAFYQQNLNGVQLHLQDPSTSLTLFQAPNSFAFDRIVLAPTGLGTLSQTLHPNIVPGSEQIFLVARDRTTGVILSQTLLTANVDYLIDDLAGTLIFLNVPTPYDGNFNPQTIVITYEYQGAHTSAETLGGALSQTIGRSVTVGVGYVNDSMGTGNYTLANQDVTVRLPQNGLFSVAHATSNGLSPLDVADLASGAQSGNAWDLAYNEKIEKTQITAGFTDTSPGFTSPFGGLSTPGLRAYNLDLTQGLGGHGAFEFDTQAERQTSATGENEGSLTALRYHRDLGKHVTATVALQHVTSNVVSSSPSTQASPVATAAPSSGATSAPSAESNAQYELGATWTPDKHFDLLADRIGGFGLQANSLYPPQTRVEAGWKTKAGRLYVRQLWSDAPSGSVSDLGLNLLNPASTTGQLSGTTSTTEFGFQRQISPATTLDTGIAEASGPAGHSVYVGNELKEHLNFSKAFSFTAGVQAANPLSTTGEPQGFAVYDGELAYANPSGLHGAASWQERNGQGDGTSLNLALTGPLARSLSVLAWDMLSSNPSTIARQDRIGLAWRPQSEAGAALIDYENQSASGNVYGTTTTNLLATDAVIRPTHGLELAGRLAYKLNGDGYYAAHTVFYGARATQHLGNLFDIGAEYDLAAVPGLSTADNRSCAAELGFDLSSTARLAFGYSFQGAVDPSLANAPNRSGVYATITSAIDRVFGWGRK